MFEYSTGMSVNNMEQFRGMVQEYVDLHDQITRARQQIKAINERKTELESVIKEFMDQNKINVIDTAAGKIKMFSSATKPALKRDVISNLLTERLGPTVASQVLHIVYDDRETVNTQKVKVIPKAN